MDTLQSPPEASDMIGLVMHEADTKCSVCWSIPCWKVYTCSGAGHVTCHLCRAKGILTCSVCRQETSRNRYAEKSLHEIMIGCPYDGCETKLKQQWMKDHIDECDYQPVKCFVTGDGGLGGRCGKVLALKNFSDHLKNDHHFPSLASSCTRNFCTHSSKSSWMDGETRISNFVFPPTLHLDGVDFIFQAFQDNNDFDEELFFWVAAICTQSKAKKYEFRLKFNGAKGSKMERVEKSAIMPVLSVLDREFLKDQHLPYQSCTYLNIAELQGMCTTPPPSVFDPPNEENANGSFDLNMELSVLVSPAWKRLNPLGAKGKGDGSADGGKDEKGNKGDEGGSASGSRHISDCGVGTTGVTGNGANGDQGGSTSGSRHISDCGVGTTGVTGNGAKDQVPLVSAGRSSSVEEMDI